MPDFKEQLRQFQAELDHELEQFFDQQLSSIQTIDSHIEGLISALRDFTLGGGKRIRPALLYFTYQCYSDLDLDRVLKASIACELMQSGLLIHDDIIDQDGQRRGKPTLHKVFALGKDDHFGNSIALLAGTVSGYLGLSALSGSGFGMQQTEQAKRDYIAAMLDVHYGQTLDVYAEHETSITSDQIIQIHYLKTARYSTILPFEMAHSLAHAPAGDLDRLRQIGKELGIAFQIKDDMLGLFGHSPHTGKSADNDLHKGKNTLLISQALKLADEQQRADLLDILSSKELNAEQVHMAKDIIEQTGSYQYSVNLVHENIAKAKDKLTSMNLKPQGTQFICALADFIATREI